jgi:hypothetical protein
MMRDAILTRHAAGAARAVPLLRRIVVRAHSAQAVVA